MGFRIVDCDASYVPAIMEIFNEAIVNTTALYEYQPRSLATVESWFDNKRQAGLPILGAIDANNKLLGFASYGPFRAFPAYKYTVEHSVYVQAQSRRQGVGQQLLVAIVNSVRDKQFHALIGGIDSQNAASITLHRSLGFKLVGTLPQVGYKFGRWLDLCFYQLLLDTPHVPIE